MTMEYQIYTSTCEKDTFQLGVDLASELQPGDTVAFYGDLGSGKTEFIKGICSGLNVRDLVSSPTYTIVNQYAGARERGEYVKVYHIDLYRIESVRELYDIGLDETLAENDSVKLVEWAEHADGLLPENRIEIRFAPLADENSRKIEVDECRCGNSMVGSHAEGVYSG